MKGKRVSVICANCTKPFEKSVKEYDRSNRVGRRHLCSRSCSGKLHNKEFHDRFSLAHYSRVPDENSPFRWFMKVVNARRGRLGNTDLSVSFLRELWEKQDGICPYTGWKLSLPRQSEEWGEQRFSKRASLDRIDNKLGYVQGNVQFISAMANHAKNRFADEELIEFCKAVAGHR